MHFTVEAQRLIESHVSRGDIAVDATAGNGYDTLFLARLVGAGGLVFSVDIQHEAIQRLRQKLTNENLIDRVILSQNDHANIKQIVAPKFHGRIACAMFNLGYLPLGDKSITTQRHSTIQAIREVSSIIQPGGVITVLAYVGHEGGSEEAAAVAEWMRRDAADWDCADCSDPSNPTSPILWFGRKRAEPAPA